MTKQFARYESYNDSGIEWLGEIPAHWEIKKLKYLTSFINRGITPNYTEYSEYKVVNQATFSKGFLDIDAMRFHNNKNMSNTSRGIVNENDLLIASTGGGVLGKVAYINTQVNNFVADSHVTMIRNNDLQSNKFLYYFYSVNFDLINAVLAQGSTNQTELQRDWLINMFLPSPPIEKQQLIADFLDKKTAQIDEAIAQKEQMIELLKEYRQVTINNAVTKGLDPNVPMKDSGIVWLGQIPAHWEIKKLKYLTSYINRGITPNYTEYSEYKVVNQATFSKGFLDIDAMRFHNNKNMSNTSRGIVNENDLLIASTGGGVLGKVAYINTQVNNFVADSHVTMIRNNDLQSNKFLYYFYSVNFDLINTVLAQGSTNQTELQRDWLINMFLSSPPIEEQKQIVDFLDKKTAQLDDAILLKQSEIEKLKEYKATLIDSSVTGKIKINL